MRSKKLKAFTILESVVVILVSTVLLQCVCASLALISKLNKQAQSYFSHINASQYIYWLFYQQISQNIGVSNFTEGQVKNFNREDLKKIVLFNSPENQKIELMTTKDFVQEYQLSKFIAKKVKPGSTVIKIRQLIMKKNLTASQAISKTDVYDTRVDRTDSDMDTQINIKKHKNTISTIEKIYYIGQNYVNKKLHYGLFQYSNNYSDELVADVTDMQVQKIMYLNQAYYYFKINYQNNFLKADLNKIKFIICDC